MSKDKEEFEESDQAHILSKCRLPDDWYDNRPSEDKFKNSNFGMLIPKGVKENKEIKIEYNTTT